MDLEDPYSVLRVSYEASLDEIKRAYQRLVLIKHPDKSNSIDTVDEFRKIHNAWKILSDDQLRQNYDEKRMSNNLVGINAEKIQLTEFFLQEGIYSRDCRCGNEYQISSTDIDDGYNLVQCNGCSLILEVS